MKDRYLESRPGTEFIKLVERDSDYEIKYGIPSDSISYKRIAVFEDDLEEDPYLILHKAYDLVEKEKDAGKPGAFVLEINHPSQKTIIWEVWTWSDK